MTFVPAGDEEPLEPFQLPSMVDIVFILLSFFILATQFRVLERDFTSAYQQHAAAGGAVSAQDLPASIPVTLRKLGAGVDIAVGQAALGVNNFGGITTTLTTINMPALAVVVSADPTLTVEQVAQALDAVLASPMKKVSLSSLGYLTD